MIPMKPERRELVGRLESISVVGVNLFGWFILREAETDNIVECDFDHSVDPFPKDEEDWAAPIAVTGLVHYNQETARPEFMTEVESVVR